RPAILLWPCRLPPFGPPRARPSFPTRRSSDLRVNYGLDGSIEERFLGREVIAVEDLLPSIDEAEEGEVVAILCRLTDYMVNSNMAIKYRRYFDENTDEWISKATMISDGKLADPNGVVLIKKKAESNGNGNGNGDE